MVMTIVLALPALLVIVLALGWAAASAATGGDHIARTLRAAGLRATLAVAVALLVFIAVVAGSPVALLGMPQALSPALAAAVGFLVLAVLPAGRGRRIEPVRAAGLERRGVGTVLSRRAATALLASSGATVLGLLALGVFGSDDGLGRMRFVSLTVGAYSSGAGPYPGWYYVLPMVTAVLVQLGCLALALRRLARIRSLNGQGLEQLDRDWRLGTASAMACIAVAAMLVQLGGALFLAGSAVSGLGEVGGVATGLGPVGVGLAVLGIAVLAASLGVAVLAIVRALALNALARAPRVVGAAA